MICAEAYLFGHRKYAEDSNIGAVSSDKFAW